MSAVLDADQQYVFYEEERYLGCSWFADGATTPVVKAADIGLSHIRSMLAFPRPDVLPAHVRDEEAVREAESGWWAQDMARRDRRLAWWREARFGCFVHWGVYALAGGVYKGRTRSGTHTFAGGPPRLLRLTIAHSGSVSRGAYGHMRYGGRDGHDRRRTVVRRT